MLKGKLARPEAGLPPSCPVVAPVDDLSGWLEGADSPLMLSSTNPRKNEEWSESSIEGRNSTQLQQREKTTHAREEREQTTQDALLDRFDMLSPTHSKERSASRRRRGFSGARMANVSPVASARKGRGLSASRSERKNVNKMSIDLLQAALAALQLNQQAFVLGLVLY